MNSNKEIAEQKPPLTHKLNTLLEAGFISATIGELPDSQLPMGMVLWARLPPPIGFELPIEISKYLRNKPLTILLDDVLPKGILKRTFEEQDAVNQTYIEFFTSRGCQIELASNIYQERYQDKPFPALFELADRLSLNDFLHLLPEKKEKIFDSLTLIEVVHALNELNLFEIIREKTDTIIIPHFSQGMSVAHRNITQNPLKMIVTPVFGSDDDMKSEIRRIKELIAK